MKYLHQIGLLFGLCATLTVAAQTPVYTCDFENETERASWTLNPVANSAMKLANKWYMGAAGHFAPQGKYGLFVSSDGQTPSYDASQTMFTAAVRSIPNVPKGSYNLYFDWKCAGKAGTSEGLYVCWIPDSIEVNGATGVAGLPVWAKTYCCHDSVLLGNSSWTIGKVQIDHDGTPHKLVFLYFCSRGKEVAPAACIDNIELRAVARCAAPTKLTHTMRGDTVVLSWKGTAAYYDLKCYDASTNSWVEKKHITKTTCSLPGVSEGVRIFILRAFCSDTTASDFVQYTPLIFHNGVRCIDYLDLKGSNCVCAYGTYETPSQTRGVVDYGYADWESRHTLHYIPDEYDEHTNYNLRTCPDGYLASVRLGHGDTGHGWGQSITYTYTIKDYNYSVLKIKYAVVLENPHDYANNPQFWLDVRCKGKMLSDSCGYAFFQANDGAKNGWREGAKGWVYKDWSEHTIDLRSYVGKTLTISLVTTDCKPAGHTGYVYFVLDCENGDMRGGNCGEDTLSTTFTAPSGFDYVWYDPASPRDTLSRAQTFTIEGMDTIEYCVNLINKKRSSCWYTLTASGMPRMPRPSMTYTVRCQNEVEFKNLTAVWRRNIFHEEGKQWSKTSDPVTYVRWDFGDDSEPVETLDSIVTHTYPLTGGQYTLTLTASISNGECSISKSFSIEGLADWSNRITRVEENLCKSENPWGYSFNVPADDGQVGTKPQVFYKDVDSVFHYRTRSDCDSLCHLILHFYQDGLHYDTICAGTSYSFFGRTLTEAGTYKESHQSLHGCDTTLYLYVEPKVLAKVPDTIHVCPEEGVINIPFTHLSGRMEGIHLRFDSDSALHNGFEAEYALDTTALSIPQPKDVRPNIYTAQLYYTNPLCQFDPQTLYIEERYSASIITQLPGVLVLKNSKYNGGYEFDSYQWYRDGVKVGNGTRPNLSVKQEDMGHEFYVEVVRKGETTPVCTCPIVYGQTAVEQVSVSDLSFPVQVWTAQGMRIGEVQTVEALNELQNGFYILSDGKHTTKILR